jgi:hypothetical protein
VPSRFRNSERASLRTALAVAQGWKKRPRDL